MPALAKPEVMDNEFLRDLVIQEDVGSLVAGLFGHDLSEGQEDIARTIAFPEPTTTRDGVVGARVAVVSPTQYGKTQAFADGLGVRFVIDPAPLRVKGIGPKEEQAAIFRDRFAKLIVRQPLLGDLLDKRGGDTVQSLKKEVSHRRLTFTDGKEFSIHSAQGDADRIMGEGGDIVVKDEACLINADAHAKVARMMVSNPEAELYELANPWDRENVFYQHWTSSDFRRIHITLEQAIAEGRITRAFVEEQRRDLAPTMFQVLYEAVFPDQAEDQLIPWSWILRAKRSGVWPGPPPAEAEAWRKQAGADIAEGGMDKTVLARGWRGPGRRAVALTWTPWQVADTMVTAARIHELADEPVAVDENGVGKGVADRLRALGHAVMGFKGGRKPRQPARFLNSASEALWELRKSFEEDRIELWNPPQALLADLTRWRWVLVGDKVKVEVDGGKTQGNSPDHGDATALLNYAESVPQPMVAIPRRNPLGLRA